MLKLEKIAKKYQNNKKMVLNDINLEIRKGSFTFVVGKSGAGKTTLIKLLTKETDPTKGQIIFNNDDITKLSNRKKTIHRRNIGIVFQDFRLLEKKTVYENIALSMELIGTPKKTINRDVPVILDMVGLSDKARSFPLELSGGEQQRVAIARAFANKPKLLIADEPTGNLDVETSIDIMKIFSEINKRGTAVIMVTHDMLMVERYGYRVVELKNGKIIRDTERDAVPGGGYNVV